MSTRSLVTAVTIAGMLPAVLLWAWAMLGVRDFFEEALSGNPLLFLVLCSGCLGIAAVSYLLKLFFTGCNGNLQVALCLLLPAWSGLCFYVFATQTTASILVVVGPVLVSVMLLCITWAQLTSQSKHRSATRAPV